MIRFIIYIILFYFIYKTIKYLTSLVSAPQERKNDHINVNAADSKPRYNIDQKDIIEAKFEEIKPADGEKNTGSGQEQPPVKENPEK